MNNAKNWQQIKKKYDQEKVYIGSNKEEKQVKGLVKRIVDE